MSDGDDSLAVQLQIIDDRKQFCENLDTYILKSWGSKNVNHGSKAPQQYHVVAILGSQSSGKSNILYKSVHISHNTIPHRHSAKSFVQHAFSGNVRRRAGSNHSWHLDEL